jgi:hypothetical protein
MLVFLLLFGADHGITAQIRQYSYGIATILYSGIIAVTDSDNRDPLKTFGSGWASLSEHSARHRKNAMRLGVAYPPTP